MWSKEIIDKQINDGIITVTFRFTDDVTSQVVERIHRLSTTPVDEWVEKTAAVEIVKLEAINIAFDNIDVGVVGDSTPETTEERDFRIFYKKYRVLLTLQPILVIQPTLQNAAIVESLINDVVAGLQTYWNRVVE